MHSDTNARRKGSFKATMHTPWSFNTFQISTRGWTLRSWDSWTWLMECLIWKSQHKEAIRMDHMGVASVWGHSHWLLEVPRPPLVSPAEWGPCWFEFQSFQDVTRLELPVPEIPFTTLVRSLSLSSPFGVAGRASLAADIRGVIFNKEPWQLEPFSC